MLNEDIQLFPYKIQMFQELSPSAAEKRLEFAQTFGAYLASHPSKLRYIWFSDEAHFWLHGYANKQNCRIWSSENPREFDVTTLHPKRVTVWAALCVQAIIGPVFIESNVTGESYREMLEGEVLPVMHAMPNSNRFIFQQDGAKPHTSDETLLFLRRHFKNRVISNRFRALFNCGWMWPPYSPDLNPPDYFLWGGVMSRIDAT